MHIYNDYQLVSFCLKVVCFFLMSCLDIRALAVVETIESSWAIQSQTLVPLSSQQVISCDYNPSQSLDGCAGGSLPSAFVTLQSQQNFSVSGGCIVLPSKSLF